MIGIDCFFVFVSPSLFVSYEIAPIRADQAMMGPILASLLGGQEKADVAGLAKQAGNVSLGSIKSAAVIRFIISI